MRREPGAASSRSRNQPQPAACGVRRACHLIEADRADTVVVHVLAVDVEEARVHLEHAVELEATHLPHATATRKRGEGC